MNKFAEFLSKLQDLIKEHDYDCDLKNAVKDLIQEYHIT